MFSNLLSVLPSDVPKRWLVTGAAGFIGSNLVQRLLEQGQQVIGLDNFATGHSRNLDDVKNLVGTEAAARFTFVEGDIRALDTCRQVCEGVDFVLHQAALGSVPRSIKDPLTSHLVNVDGTLNMLIAARDAQVKRFVYASSSSVYGDHPGLPKVESAIGTPLSPYAVTKCTDELYAEVFQHSYGLETIGLRYFNVFGRRQDPNGPYAAVMPRWIAAMLGGRPCEIYGDGETSRDFCYVDNAVQANIRAALAPSESTGAVYNVAYGERTTLTELFYLIRDGLRALGYDVHQDEPVYRDFRPGDVRHSLADISAAHEKLGYEPGHSVRQGLAETITSFVVSAHE